MRSAWSHDDVSMAGLQQRCERLMPKDFHGAGSASGQQSGVVRGASLHLLHDRGFEIISAARSVSRKPRSMSLQRIPASA